MLTYDELKRLADAEEAERNSPICVARLELVTTLCDHIPEILEALRDRERTRSLVNHLEAWLNVSQDDFVVFRASGKWRVTGNAEYAGKYGTVEADTLPDGLAAFLAKVEHL